MASSDVQTESAEDKRRRTAEDGRIVVNVGAVFGQYICEQAEEMGLSPATIAKMLVHEAIVKYRGISKESLEEKFNVGKVGASL